MCYIYKDMNSNDLYGKVLFQDRKEAGEKLGQVLKELELKNPIVLAIPSGGVPIGYEIAKTLNAPLDLIISKKIQIPGETETGFGAVCINGEVNVLLNQPLLGQLGLTKKDVKEQTQKAIDEIRRREALLRGDKEFPILKGRDVIITDDGLASGHSMLVAVKLIKKYNPNRVIVAVPTSSGSAVKLIENEIYKLISLYFHPDHLPFAVASAYREWHDLSDDEVLKFLRE